jgi:hypothetical protein
MQINMAEVISCSLASGFLSVTKEQLELEACPKIIDLFPKP